MLDLLLSGKKILPVFVYFKYDHKHVQGQKMLTFLAKIYQNFSFISILIFSLSLELVNTYVGTYYIIIFKKTIPSASDVSLPLFLTFDRL